MEQAFLLSYYVDQYSTCRPQFVNFILMAMSPHEFIY